MTEDVVKKFFLHIGRVAILVLYRVMRVASLKEHAHQFVY